MFAPVSVACEVKVPLGVMLQLYRSPVFPTEISLITGVQAAHPAVVMVKSAEGVGYTVTVRS